MNLLNIRFELKNPWDRWEYFNNLGCISGRLFRYKAWELEHNFYTGLILDFDIRWTHQQDHAGFGINIGILGYGIGFRVYDTRHWNEGLTAWVAYD